MQVLLILFIQQRMQIILN